MVSNHAKKKSISIAHGKNGVLNAELDGQHGLMQLAGDTTLMYYLMDEAQEGKKPLF